MSISTVFRHGTYHILHPELRDKTRQYLVLRSNYFTAFFFPRDEQIAWYGGAIREDGGQGMYMTEAQAREWTSWVKNDIVIGPR